MNPYMSSAELKKASEPTKVFEECSCVEEAWMQSNGSGALSDEWIKNDHLTGWDYPSSDTVAAARAKLEGKASDSALRLSRTFVHMVLVLLGYNTNYPNIYPFQTGIFA